MKYILIVLSAVALVALASCGGEKPNRPDPVLTQDQINAQNAKFDAPEIPAGGAVASGVKHYTCPNGHAGADTQGNCVICGTALVHNQAFHDQPAAASTGADAGGEPPQNADGVWHYTCPNGHPGGGGGATACPVCGTVMVHNTEYHSGNAAATPSTDGLTTPPAPAPSAEPPQNAAGVWHYTCPNGHEGGGGSATPCSVCGTTLVHNTEYHN